MQFQIKKVPMLNSYLLRCALLSLCVGLSACSQPAVYTSEHQYYNQSVTKMPVPRHTIDVFIQQMAEELVKTNSGVMLFDPIAITSILELQTLNDTNWLGNVLADGLIYEMQSRGYTVLDYKNTGVIKVRPDGDFSITRSWKELKGHQNITYVLTGTMSRQPGGVIVNMRLINMYSHLVKATARGFLPVDKIGRDLDDNHKIKKKDGVLVREDFPEKSVK